MTDAQLDAFDSSSCESCGSDVKLHVDHDHACCPSGSSCGKCVRGFLCAPCNQILGFAKDDIAQLKGLVSYLERKTMCKQECHPQGDDEPDIDMMGDYDEEEIDSEE